MDYLDRIVFTGFASCMLFAVPAVKATPTIVGTVQLDTESGVYPGMGGGEFTAYTSQNFVQNYATAATYNGGFETFCLETGVDFNPGNTYNYSLGNVSQPLSGGGAGSGLALTAGAAWLYQQFATGGLQGFDYTYSDAADPNGRMNSDTLLQEAIWALQGGQSYTQGGYQTLSWVESNDQFYIDALANGGSNPYAGGPVEVLQLWDNSGNAAQNQLVLVPDGGETVALLGIGLMGVFLVQFRQRKLA